MAEPEPPGNVCGVNQSEAQELIEGIEHRRLWDSCCGRRELGIERITGHSGAFKDEARVFGQEGEFRRQRGRNKRGNINAANRYLPSCRRVRAGALSRPHKLLQVERVAAGLFVEIRERGVSALVDELASLLTG